MQLRIREATLMTFWRHLNLLAALSVLSFSIVWASLTLSSMRSLLEAAIEGETQPDLAALIRLAWLPGLVLGVAAAVASFFGNWLSTHHQNPEKLVSEPTDAELREQWEKISEDHSPEERESIAEVAAETSVAARARAKAARWNFRGLQLRFMASWLAILAFAITSYLTWNGVAM
jgi:hypothetical protein